MNLNSWYVIFLSFFLSFFFFFFFFFLSFSRNPETRSLPGAKEVTVPRDAKEVTVPRDAKELTLLWDAKELTVLWKAGTGRFRPGSLSHFLSPEPLNPALLMLFFFFFFV